MQQRVHVAVGIALLFNTFAFGLDLFVSPTGKDTNPGTKDQPFGTLARARDAVREAKRAARAPIDVQIGGGRYDLAAPVSFGPEDSGTQSCPISYSAVPGEKPVVSGGRRISGWRRGEGPVWVAEIPEVKSGAWTFRQLFVNGERKPRTRLPKQGTYQVAGAANPAGSAFKFKPGQIDPNWHNRDDVEVVVLQFWTEARLRIESVDPAAHIVKFTGEAFRPLDWSKGWYVTNVREGLTAPGQWYLDRKSGVLSYWPLPGEDMERVEVVAPVTRQWIRLEGDFKAGKPVEHLSFRGLTFRYSDWTLDPKLGYSYPQAAIELVPQQPQFVGWQIDEGPSKPQSQIEVPAGIYASGAHHVRFEYNEIAHTGGWGVTFLLGCQDNAIVGNHLYDLGAGAIRVGSPDIAFDDGEESCRTVISDNRIHDGDTVYLGAPAIWIGQSSGNQVSHNEISGAFQWAISVGWNWGYMPPNRARDNQVEFNHVHDLGAGDLGTHGAIYFLGVQPGTVVRHNHIHHIGGGGSGIVLDNGSVAVVVEHNVVHHAEYASLLCNHNDLGNIVQNNIFALAGKSQMYRIGDIPSNRAMVHQTGVFYRNLFYWRGAPLFERDDWINYDIIMDYNLYFDASGAPPRFTRFTFDEWKKKGLDSHSVVADPLFVDPEQGDFRLRPGSPALKLGFKAIDLSVVGPRSARAGRR
jgi:hypothetical protein